MPIKKAECWLLPMALSLRPQVVSRNAKYTKTMATRAKTTAMGWTGKPPRRGSQAIDGNGSVPLIVAPSAGFQGPKIK